MARGSLHLSMFVQGDHLNHEGDVSEIRITVADNHRVDAHLVEFDWQGKCEWVVVARSFVFMASERPVERVASAADSWARSLQNVLFELDPPVRAAVEQFAEWM